AVVQRRGRHGDADAAQSDRLLGLGAAAGLVPGGEARAGSRGNVPGRCRRLLDAGGARGRGLPARTLGKGHPLSPPPRRGPMVPTRRWMSLILCCLPALAGAAPIHLDRIKLPPGFKIDVYAENVENAREMVLSPGGILFVSTRRAGNVYALTDTKRANKADRVVTIAKGLQNPNGVAFRDGAL